MIGGHIGTLAKDVIGEISKEKSADTIVMCDFMTTNGVLRQFGVDAQTQLPKDVGLVAVDTWAVSRSMRAIDVFGAKKIEIGDWISQLPCLAPSPLVPLDFGPGACAFMPEQIRVPASVRQHVRSNLSIGKSEKAVLFCTANWQQSLYDDANGERISSEFPKLLAEYLSRVRGVHLIHVGPSAIDAFRILDARYHWLPPLGTQFDDVLGSIDLLISANISASTITKAISSRIPVLVLENSCQSKTAEEAADWLGGEFDPFVAQLLPSMIPLYPFSLWPLGFYDFLKPITGCEYRRAFEVGEWLHCRRTTQQIESLLYSVEARDGLRDRQESYCKRISELPSAAEAFLSL